MKFLKLIQSETEIDKSLEYDVLYYNSTSAKITVSETNPITSTTYEVKNVSNPTSLPYDATSMVVSFTGIKTKTYKKGQIEVTETSETETVSFEANTSSAETATRSGSFEWNEQPVAWSTTLGVAPAIKITTTDALDTDIIALSAEKSASVEGTIAWSCNLASDIAEINGSTLTFKQHYEGSVTLTATADNASAKKTITVSCEEVATATTYSIKANSISVAETQPMDAESTSATVNFVGVTTQYYKLKDSVSVESNETQTVEFEANGTTEVVTRNGSFDWNGENVEWEVLLSKKLNTNGYEYVDLGLPSGILWASCNIGATKPEKSGLFFQWGATQGYTGDEAKVHSTWSTAPFNNGSSNYDGDYFVSVSGQVVNSNNVLLPEYDAAHVNMGGDWRLPKYGEIIELTANTISTWYPSFNTEFDGIGGVKFTSKTDSSKYIFIPESGYYSNGSRNNAGVIWNSAPPTSQLPSSGTAFKFSSGNLNMVYISRCSGLPVRAVMPKA